METTQDKRYLDIEESLIAKRNNFVDILTNQYIRFVAIEDIGKKNPDEKIKLPVGDESLGGQTFAEYTIPDAKRVTLMGMDHTLGMIDLYDKHIEAVKKEEPIAKIKKLIDEEKKAEASEKKAEVEPTKKKSKKEAIAEEVSETNEVTN